MASKAASIGLSHHHTGLPPLSFWSPGFTSDASGGDSIHQASGRGAAASPVHPALAGDGLRTQPSAAYHHTLSPALPTLSIMDKQLFFMQQEHHKLLTALHHELDTLKQENKALKFRLVFGESKNSSSSDGLFLSSTSTTTSDQWTETDGAMEVLNVDNAARAKQKTPTLELRKLRQELSSIKLENKQLKSQVEFYKRLERQRDVNEFGLSTSSSRHPLSAGPALVPVTTSASRCQSPLSWSVSPLLVHARPLGAPGAAMTPTIQECEEIITHLHNINTKLKRELAAVKGDLQELIQPPPHATSMLPRTTSTTPHTTSATPHATCTVALPSIMPHPPDKSRPTQHRFRGESSSAGSGQSLGHRKYRQTAGHSSENVNVHLTLPALVQDDSMQHKHGPTPRKQT